MTVGFQGSLPEADGRPVMNRAGSPSLLARGDPYPAPIQAARPPDPIVGRHYYADEPWPTPKGYPGAGPVYAGPLPEDSQQYPAVHKTEPLGLPKMDVWKEIWWFPPRIGNDIWGQSYPRAVPAAPNDGKFNIRHSLFTTWHPTGQQLETRMCLGGHAVIRRIPTPTGLPGQTPYYQAPNTLRSGPPPRWDQGLLANPYSSGVT